MLSIFVLPNTCADLTYFALTRKKLCDKIFIFPLDILRNRLLLQSTGLLVELVGGFLLPELISLSSMSVSCSAPAAAVLHSQPSLSCITTFTDLLLAFFLPVLDSAVNVLHLGRVSQRVGVRALQFLLLLLLYSVSVSFRALIEARVAANANVCLSSLRFNTDMSRCVLC